MKPTSRGRIRVAAGWMSVCGIAVRRAAITRNPVRDSAADRTNCVNGAFQTNFGYAFIMPPGPMAYLNDQGLVAITTNFDATGLEPVSSLNFTTYPLQVVETNESSRIRLYLNATGGVILTTAAPAEYDASNWVRTVYGNPGPWLTGTNLDLWYADRDPGRQRLTMTLIAEADLTNYLAAMSNAAPVVDDGSGTNVSLLVLYSNDIAVVQTENLDGVLRFMLHAPAAVTNFSIFSTLDLADTNAWELAASLAHINDPMLFQALETRVSETSTVWKILAAGDGSLDTDADGLPDAIERLLTHTDPAAADTDGDGLADGQEFLQYASNPNAYSTATNGLSDGWLVANNMNPSAWVDPETLAANGLTFAQLSAIGAATSAPVIDLAPADVVMQAKLVTATRHKCGFEGFLYSSNIYLSHAVYQLTDCKAEDTRSTNCPPLPTSKTTVNQSYSYAAASATLASSGSMTHDYWMWRPDGECETAMYCGQTKQTWTGCGDFITEPQNLCEGIPLETNVEPAGFRLPPGLSTNLVATNDAFVSYSTPPGDLNSVDETRTLSTIYTWDMLKQNTDADITELKAHFPQMGTNKMESKTVLAQYDCSTNHISYFTTNLNQAIAAFRATGASGTTMTAGCVQYWVSLGNSTTGIVYRATMAHVFTPADAPTNEVLETHELIGKTTGTGGYILLKEAGSETAHVTIDPPDINGSIQPHVVRLAIAEPDGLPPVPLHPPDAYFRYGPACFEWQYVHPSNVPANYSQLIAGIVDSTNILGAFRWTVSQGSLDDDSTITPSLDASALPSDADMTQVTLTLECPDTPDLTSQTRTLQVFRDHLARDYHNFKTGTYCGSSNWTFSADGLTITNPTAWNCFGSVLHAYNGSGNGWCANAAFSLPSEVFTSAEYTNVNAWTDSQWNNVVSNLNRGDVVVFYSDTGIQHAHTYMGQKVNLAYGANNDPGYEWIETPGSDPHVSPRWKWNTIGIRDYFIVMNEEQRKMRHDPNFIFLKKIVIYRR